MDVETGSARGGAEVELRERAMRIVAHVSLRVNSAESDYDVSEVLSEEVFVDERAATAYALARALGCGWIEAAPVLGEYFDHLETLFVESGSGDMDDDE